MTDEQKPDSPAIPPASSLAEEATDELKHAALKESIVDDFDAVHSRIAPIIWCLAFDIAREQNSTARLNAILNSLLTTTLSWIVAMMPQDTEAQSGAYDVIRGKFIENLDMMVADRENIRKTVTELGNGVGRQYLMAHQNAKVADAINNIAGVLELMAQPPEGPLSMPIDGKPN